MSQDSEIRSQASLAPAAEILIPSTPPRRSVLSASPDLKTVRERNGSLSDKNGGGFCSPQHASSSKMTPPPSSQTRAPPRRRSRSGSGSRVVVPASPPNESLEKSLYAAYGAAENLPTAEDIDAADELQVRKIAKDLLSIAQEARMSALHFKLQNSLLSFTSNEAIKRAEVEQQLARREVEILQSSEYQNRRAIPHSQTPQICPSPKSEASLKRIAELENINVRLEERLSNAKKLIQEKIDEGNNKNESLIEENRLLKKRIRDNREHLTMFLDAGSLSPASRAEFSTPQRKAQPRMFDSARTHTSSRGGSHDAFATLLAADRVLHGDSTNVSPNRNRQHRNGHIGGAHVRGAHSMSSLPVTPQRYTHIHESQYITPGSRTHEDARKDTFDPEDNRHDRDSTISVSDADEVVTDEDIPASQASSRATGMLRRLPELSQEPSKQQQSARSNIGKSSTLLQTKLFGQVRKAGVDRSGPASQKRKGSFVEEGAALKKPKDVGLGLAKRADSASKRRPLTGHSRATLGNHTKKKFHSILNVLQPQVKSVLFETRPATTPSTIHIVRLDLRPAQWRSSTTTLSPTLTSTRTGNVVSACTSTSPVASTAVVKPVCPRPLLLLLAQSTSSVLLCDALPSNTTAALGPAAVSPSRS
uniref:Uncharacterized protein n=1 Tax=Talaromyces marneffei PM1 TaxID=1077442 RepID=A0A093UX92_TALMA